ncbi:MAG TPA: hypothetical protein VFI34_10585 [Candidatus Limnocylindrales bacterium]|nr:hypothetical protein [Candidatus Limnocylindrales bacterium]
MDATQLIELFAIGATLTVTIRSAVRTLDHAESGFASLFVPPDRTLPWPRGVQESDSPWGWHPPIRSADDGDGLLDLRSEDSASAWSGPAAIGPETGHSRYEARPIRVDPIRFRTLPQ